MQSVDKRFRKHPFPLSNFLKSLVVAQQKKQSQLKYYRFSKIIYQHAALLQRLGYIYGYSIQSDNPKQHINVITIDLKYSITQVPLIRSIRFYSSPSRSWWLRLREVNRLSTRSAGISQFVISTSGGLQTATECAYRQISGMLLYKIN